MIVTTIDPVTGNRVQDLEHHPFVVEGGGAAQTKIYFESEATRQAYLAAQPDDPSRYTDNNTEFHS
ncbi:hypothetical protein DFR30_2820 [Thiogranum longum]|uniref:Uncharacterized protein n=1 Tax=Thiogranum longum TaxID=1537524 RepID=A0A4R1HBY6_9GAMM|nr:hypothetical protein [Thiogranum longum]TCK19507.1 hypothetical protein DFR30_2820 [Thiogranum longum]